MLKTFSISLFLFFSFLIALPQEERDPEENLNQLRVFLDCRQCDMQYFRQELNIIDYVRNRDDADVHIFVTANRTSSQRLKFEISMIGKGLFEGQDFSMNKYTAVEPTANDIRKSLKEIIQIGLVPYLGQTNLADAVKVSIEKQRSSEPEIIEDPWNFWVFEVEGSGSWNKETSQSRLRYSSSLSAERVTEMWRIRSSAYMRGSEYRVDNEGETISTSTRDKGAYLSVVKSMGPHFSAGLSTSYSTSIFRNIASSSSLRAAFEYNLFPYDEVSKRELTIAYRIGPYFRQYDEITIYDKLQEKLLRESLSINLRMRQPWGNIFAGLTGGHYLHDLGKYRMELNASANLRIYKGLNFRLGGNYELIRDQLSLPKGSASIEDIILRQKQIAKGFESSLFVGISYTFGSIYNNVVNTRL